MLVCVLGWASLSIIVTITIQHSTKKVAFKIQCSSVVDDVHRESEPVVAVAGTVLFDTTVMGLATQPTAPAGFSGRTGLR